jgi:hypothetical protein
MPVSLIKTRNLNLVLPTKDDILTHENYTTTLPDNTYDFLQYMTSVHFLARPVTVELCDTEAWQKCDDILLWLPSYSNFLMQSLSYERWNYVIDKYKETSNTAYLSLLDYMRTHNGVCPANYLFLPKLSAQQIADFDFTNPFSPLIALSDETQHYLEHVRLTVYWHYRKMLAL